MRRETLTLEVPTANGAGASRKVDGLRNITVHVYATALSATITIEGTVDGVRWFPIQAITAAALIAFPAVLRPAEIRATVSSYVSSTGLGASVEGEATA